MPRLLQLMVAGRLVPLNPRRPARATSTTTVAGRDHGQKRRDACELRPGADGLARVDDRDEHSEPEVRRVRRNLDRNVVLEVGVVHAEHDQAPPREGDRERSDEAGERPAGEARRDEEQHDVKDHFVRQRPYLPGDAESEVVRQAEGGGLQHHDVRQAAPRHRTRGATGRSGGTSAVRCTRSSASVVRGQHPAGAP